MKKSWYLMMALLLAFTIFSGCGMQTQVAEPLAGGSGGDPGYRQCLNGQAG